VKYDEFVDRVAERAEITERAEAEKRRSVFGTLREAVTWGELEDVLAQLDPEYAELLA
jgi:uncharacterized protein (DUF2267 family)